MSRDWENYLNADPIKWLLEEENPSVRFFTLRDLVGNGTNEAKISLARDMIMEQGIVPKILSKQERGGYWEEEEHFYIRNKYKGTVWQFIILAELGADGRDNRIIDSCEYLLDYSQDRQSGGFSYRGTRKNGGHHSGVLPCLTGNMIWSLIVFGCLDDVMGKAHLPPGRGQTVESPGGNSPKKADGRHENNDRSSGRVFIETPPIQEKP